MKKKILSSFILIMSFATLVGCSTASNVPKSTETVTETPTTTPKATPEPITPEPTTTPEQPTTSEQTTLPEQTMISEPTTSETTTPESTEAPHEHIYTEAVTTEATCEAEGLKTFTCECGDAYTEVITATAHIFGDYTFNNDATYLADGTETAKCNNCDVTDTRTVEGSMLSYTYTDMNATMYAQQDVNVRSMPSTDGEKLGSLSTNDEVKVTGQCVETSWYRIEFDGNTAYVSNSYLGENKVEISVTNNNSNSSVDSASSDFPYELLTRYVTPDGKISYFYCTEDCGWKTHGWHQVWYTCNNYNNVTFGHETAPGYSYETTMSTFTICDDMDGYIQAATANGLVARQSVETPWKTADGKKIRAFCP